MRLDEWAARHTVDSPENASVLIFNDCGAISASLCQRDLLTLYTSTLWCEYDDETGDFSIVSDMDEVVRYTTTILRQPDEPRAALPLRAWSEDIGKLDYEHDRTSVVATHPWRPSLDPATPGAIDFALRNLVDVDTGEQTTLSTLVHDFLGKPLRSHDYFLAENLDAVASRAGKAIFAESDPSTAEKIFESLFDLGFHLHQDPDGAAYWSLARDGVNANAVVCREAGANRLFACLVPNCKEPLLLCTSLLSIDVQDANRKNPQ